MSPLNNIIKEDFLRAQFGITFQGTKSEALAYLSSQVKLAFAQKSVTDSLILRAEDTEIKLALKENYDNDEIVEFFRQIEQVFDNDENIQIQGVIIKDQNHCSIYSIDKLCDYLDSLSVQSQLEIFQESFQHEFPVSFYVLIDSIDCATHRYVFTRPELPVKPVSSQINRREMLNLRQNFCSFVGERNIKSIPSDFWFYNNNLCNVRLNDIFFRLTLVTTLISLADISELSDSHLRIRINGYRIVNLDLDLDKETINQKTIHALYQLYEWVYTTESAISDKIGIARNLLSLYINNGEINTIDTSIIGSARSNYELYLKGNVEQYLQLVNQQTLFLNEIVDDVSKLSQSYTDGFRLNMIGFFSFILTTVVFNVISTGKLSNIFTKDIAAILIVLIIISMIYMCASKKDADEGFVAIHRKYERNKRIQSLVVEQSDLERILDFDHPYNKAKSESENKLKRWRRVWMFINILILTFTVLCYVCRPITVSDHSSDNSQYSSQNTTNENDEEPQDIKQ